MTLVRSSHLRAGERAHGAAVPRRLQQRHGAGGALLLTPHLRAVPRPLAKAKPHRLQREWIEWMVWIVSNLLWFVVVYCDFITFHYFNLLQLIWQNKSLRHMSKKVADWRSCATHECLHLLDRFGPWSKNSYTCSLFHMQVQPDWPANLAANPPFALSHCTRSLAQKTKQRGEHRELQGNYWLWRCIWILLLLRRIGLKNANHFIRLDWGIDHSLK